DIGEYDAPTYIHSLRDRLARTIHENLLRRPILSPGTHSAFSADGKICLCRPHLREATVGFSLERLATTFVNNPG
ncbi:MAG TPA: hypothetical protein VK901_22255, partial [Nitrospiraceae bacterium]|nr:hypothetical protein [Nitrospiraceae bacterium]